MQAGADAPPVPRTKPASTPHSVGHEFRRSLRTGAPMRRARASGSWGENAPADSPFWYTRDPRTGFAYPSGRNVTHDSALTIGAVFRAVQLVSRDIAALPQHTMRILPLRRTEDGRSVPGGKERIKDDLDFVLNKRPNPRLTPFQYREMKLNHVLLRGNHFSRILSGHRGYVTSLEPLTTWRMRAELLDSGRVLYLYQRANGVEERLTQDEVHHVRGFNPDPEDPCGLSVVGLASRSLGLALQTEEYGSRQFSQAPRPSVAFEVPGGLEGEDERALQDMYMRAHSGPDGWFRPYVAKNGMTVKPIPGMTHDEAQFLQTRTFQIAEVARWFGVPLHMLSELTRATFSNIEHQSIEYVVHALLPWVALDEQCIERDFLEEEDDREVEYNLEGLLRGDSITRARVYQLLANLKAITPNEVRHREGLNPVPWGDDPLQPQGAPPAESAAEDDQPPPEPVDDDDAGDDVPDDASALSPINRIAAMYRGARGQNGRTNGR